MPERGIDGRDDAAKPPCEALWRQSSQPQRMCKVALPSARPKRCSMGIQKRRPNPNHYRDFITCDPILSMLLKAGIKWL
jgi:hypothetical protein